MAGKIKVQQVANILALRRAWQKGPPELTREIYDKSLRKVVGEGTIYKTVHTWLAAADTAYDVGEEEPPFPFSYEAPPSGMPEGVLDDAVLQIIEKKSKWGVCLGYIR
ncbi:hypothetical protein FRC10_004303 [Ceratobasidium sp. 414]|nr:hypothetical protein FRC10_004303 [Ceratobasidium sp. 414]